MKLFYFASSPIPSRAANGVHVMKMCRAFARLGLDVTLLVPGHPDKIAAPIGDPYAYYGVSRTFALRETPAESGRGKAWRSYRAIRSMLGASRPDFVYGRDLLGVFAASRAGIPCALELHAPLSGRMGHLKFHARILEYALYRFLSRSHHYKGTVVISHALKDLVLTETPWLGLKPVIVAHDAADDTAGAASAANPLPSQGRLRAGYVGHLYPGRGIDVIVKLATALSGVDFHVIGGTDKDINLWRGAASPPNLIFHGHVPPSEVPGYQMAMDVLLAPYQHKVGISGEGALDTGRFMSPLKLFEYMAAGKAIVCSDLPVLREILDDQCALLVPPADEQAWIAALKRLEDNPGLRESLGIRARSMFLAGYTWDKRAEFIHKSVMSS